MIKNGRLYIFYQVKELILSDSSSKKYSTAVNYLGEECGESLQKFYVSYHWLKISLHLRNSICHSVRSECTHHAQFLKGCFIFPLLRELLFLWALAFYELLPTFSRPFNVSVKVAEFFHRWKGLKDKHFKFNIPKFRNHYMHETINN